MKILCLLTDIFFMPEIKNVLGEHEIVFGDGHLNEDFDLFVLDMLHKESIGLCKKYPEKSVCFGPHSDAKLMGEFASTGCKNIFPRLIFIKKLREVVK